MKFEFYDNFVSGPSVHLGTPSETAQPPPLPCIVQHDSILCQFSAEAGRWVVHFCRDEMERKLREIRDEVENLQNNEQTQINREKKEALARIKKEV